MPRVNWSTSVDLERALANVQTEFRGDWFKDPWGWPEMEWVATSMPELAVDNLRSTGAHRVAMIEVPKENWGVRPAVVLDVLDRLCYQALVDRLSLRLIGGLHRDVYGWRLSPDAPAEAVYERNSKQWEAYRARLKDHTALNLVALKTDIVSFFASISTEVAAEAILDKVRPGPVPDRLISFLQASSTAPRPGLPQRSLASAVIANLVLGPIDDVLRGYTRPIETSGVFASLLSPGFTRWMDDIWLFVGDPAIARQAQRDLQSAARELGLNLNSAKTDLLEGEEMARQALLVEHSAVDDAISDEADFGKLEEMIDSIISDPDHATRTAVNFAVTRMLRHGSSYRTDDLLSVASRMPHVADSLARLFKNRFRAGDLQDWFLDYVESPWSGFEWSIAQYGRMFASGVKPRRALREYFESQISSANTSLPLLAIAGQRLSRWDTPACRTAAAEALLHAANPQARRVLALCALASGAQRRSVARWLGVEPENRVTLKMLKDLSFRAPAVRSTYSR